MNDKNNKLIILIGLPSSGKSTYIKNDIFKENTININKKNTIILSSDDIREELFNFRNQNNNQLVFDTMNKRCKNALNNNINVIYDATNLNRKRRIMLIEAMKNSCKTVVGLCFICSFNTILKRNEQRDSKISVPKEILFKMLNNFNTPIFNEGFDIIKFIDTNKSYCQNLSIFNILKNNNILYNLNLLKDILKEDSKKIPYSKKRKLWEKYRNKIITECYNKSSHINFFYRNILLLSVYYYNRALFFNEENENLYIDYKNKNYINSYISMCDCIKDFNNLSSYDVLGTCILLDISFLIENQKVISGIRNDEVSLCELKKDIGDNMYKLLLILDECYLEVKEYGI